MSRSGGSVGHHRWARRPRRRIRWPVATAIACLLLLASLFALWGAISGQPGWYRPAAVDAARLHEDKRELVALLDGIGEALNRGQPVSFELREDQLNRWIAARAEMWPEAAVELGPLQEPQIVFSSRGIQAAGRLHWGRSRALGVPVASGVASGRFRIEVPLEGVRIVCDQVRLGRLPIPPAWLLRWAGSSLAADTDRMQLDDDDGLTLRNDWLWPNGRKRFRIASLRVSDGVAHIVLEPLARMP